MGKEKAKNSAHLDCALSDFQSPLRDVQWGMLLLLILLPVTRLHFWMRHSSEDWTTWFLHFLGLYSLPIYVNWELKRLTVLPKITSKSAELLLQPRFVDSRSFRIIAALARLTFAGIVGWYSFWGEGLLFHTWSMCGTPINCWGDESFILLDERGLMARG